ncbi:DUF4157 domain-containing protein [Kutzneria sp. NPDC052558]|uniref:eCIS core domain-containing protein n=1 Tax=Kutzneria sp. NPDC052558 TaxID=3364121 RepID=UPI0037C872CC
MHAHEEPAKSEQTPFGALVRAFEAGTGEDLSDVHVHDGPDAAAAAQQRHAAAFTTGGGMFFARGRFAPDTPKGRGLLAHELTHVVQQRRATADGGTGVAAEDEARSVTEALAAGRPLPGIRAHAGSPVQDQDEDEDSPDIPAPGSRQTTTAGDPDDGPLADTGVPADFPIRIAAAEPDQLVVPGLATRVQIANRLFGTPARQADFDVVPSTQTHAAQGVQEQAIRIRDGRGLAPGPATQLRSALESALTADVDWTVLTLSQRFINDSDEWNLVERCLRWSQRSALYDTAGRQYFDRYLDALSGRSLTSPGLFSNTTHTALEWLLIETGSKAEQIRKAMQLRSSRSAGYTVTDTRPEFAVGDVVGRFYWASGSGLQLRVAGTIADEPTLERAETATRNAPYLGLRIVVPGGNGRFYGYRLFYPTLDPLIVPPEDDAGGHFYWYHPGTVFIRANEFRPDFPAGDAAHRGQILAAALSTPEPRRAQAVLGLDFDVLAQATVEQRVALIDIAVRTPAADAAAGLVARVLSTTSSADFPRLEQRISAGPLLNLLLSMPIADIAVFGRLFTVRALGAMTYDAAGLQRIETFQLGEDSAGVIHAAFGVPVPAQDGRNAIVFQVLVSHSMTDPLREQRRSRPFRPTELVRIEVVGARPQTQIVTALEAAGLLGGGATAIAVRRITQYQQVLMWAQAGTGLARAFGPALASGLAQGGFRAGLAALGAEAATQGGRVALRQFAFQAALLGSMQVVDAYRQELGQTAAGRDFLAAYDIAMGVLVARDVYRLLSSGLLTEVGRLGRLAVAAVGQAGARALGRAVQEFEALTLAWGRLRPGELVEVALADGTRALQPRDPQRFTALYMQARAEVAGSRLLSTLTAAGQRTAAAERVVPLLQQIAARDAQAAKHVTAVLRAAAELAPASVDAFLSAIEQVLRARPALEAELTGFLRAATREGNPIAYLADVRWLVSQHAISDDAVRVFAQKAPTRYAVDLAWLRTTGLTPQDISRLGADPITKWNEFRRAALAAADLSIPLADRRELVIRALTKTRGIAAELAVDEQEAAGGIVPGHRISGKQVEMGDSIIDFEVAPTGRTGQTRGFEVKGHNLNRWRELMNAWDRRAATDLTNTERGFLRNLAGIGRQLADAAAARGGRAPFLGVTSQLNAPTRARLTAWLATEAPPGTQLIFVDEARIQAVYKRLQTALHLEVPAR